MKRKASALMALTALAGCSVEPETVVDARGPVASAPATDKSSFGVFQARYSDLVVDPNSPQKAYAVVEAGTELEYQLCSSFFASAGRQQQVLLFSKGLDRLRRHSRLRRAGRGEGQPLGDRMDRPRRCRRCHRHQYLRAKISYSRKITSRRCRT